MQLHFENLLLNKPLRGYEDKIRDSAAFQRKQSDSSQKNKNEAWTCQMSWWEMRYSDHSATQDTASASICNMARSEEGCSTPLTRSANHPASPGALRTNKQDHISQMLVGCMVALDFKSPTAHCDTYIIRWGRPRSGLQFSQTS